MVNQLFNQRLYRLLRVGYQILFRQSMQWEKMVSLLLEKMGSRFRYRKFWVQMGNLQLTLRRGNH